jgi:hypothetical protein
MVILNENSYILAVLMILPEKNILEKTFDTNEIKTNFYFKF